MKKGKILIVDDNEDILFTLKLLLRPLAESVTLLSDPRELLPVISRTRFDVILLDMNFRRDAVSGKEGFHWLEEILRLDAKAVVIFITAYADTEKAVQAIKHGPRGSPKRAAGPFPCGWALSCSSASFRHQRPQLYSPPR